MLKAPMANMPNAPQHGWDRWWPLLGALVYASVLALLPGENLRDRYNYLAYLGNAQIIMLGWLDGDIVQILSNEPLWILINFGFSLVWPPEMALRMMIFIPAAIVADRMLRVAPRHVLALLVFLLLPQVLKNHIVHLRQGLGLAVFLLGWFAATTHWRLGLWLLTPFIHSSFFFVLMLVVMAWLALRWRAPLHVIWAAFALVGISVGLTLGALVRAAEARQAEEIEFTAAQGISGLGFLFWLLLLLFLLLQPRQFKRQHMIEIGGIIFYLSTYFFSPVAARIFESTMPLVLLSGLRMRQPGRLIFLAAILAFGCLQWLMMWAGSMSIFTES
jgi:hypothetical protein